MDYLDSKYVSLISHILEKFKRVKADLYNFRCPICGDSKKNKNKARGYIYSVKNNTNFKCHNCGSSTSFNNFLKSLDPSVHGQYSLEKFKEGHTGKNFVVDEPEFNFEKPDFKEKVDLPSCSEVEIASKYLQNRAIDPSKFYFAKDFASFVKTYKEVDYENLREEPRIVIPLYFQKKIIGFQGRSLNSKSIKYITVMLHDGAPKIYGLDDVNHDEKIYITEVPFDSTFIRNSIAMCGADADPQRWGINNSIWIYDNEPRNKEIVQRISKHIESGDSVVIWPSDINEKDINDMVLAGHNVQNLVELNTYSGLESKLKFTTWKKI